VSDDLPLQERVERHLDRHPDASIPAIAGALGEPPAAVAEVLGEHGLAHRAAPQGSFVQILAVA